MQYRHMMFFRQVQENKPDGMEQFFPACFRPGGDAVYICPGGIPGEPDFPDLHHGWKKEQVTIVCIIEDQVPAVQERVSGRAVRGTELRNGIPGAGAAGRSFCRQEGRRRMEDDGLMDGSGLALKGIETVRNGFLRADNLHI